MYRGNILIGTVVQLYRIQEEKKLGNIIFTKNVKGSWLKREEHAVDCLSNCEFAYFKDGILSHYQSQLLQQYAYYEQVVVQHGYSLNSYFKTRNYPVFIPDEKVRDIIQTEYKNIITNSEVVQSVLENERAHFLEVDTHKTKLLIL
ncbi:MAG: hypothetical protein PUB18_05470 [bacterium]|nr:hypothetical protein [bacterium]